MALAPLSEDEIERAIADVRQTVQSTAPSQERGYWQHEQRYRRSVRRIGELVPRGATVLDVGSHFLHQSMLLSALGYRVVGVDVPEFAADERIRARALRLGIENHSVPRLDGGDFLPGCDDSIDCVVFCEILEHVTFNPIAFWKRIYALLKVGGKIYITTPNGMRIWQVASSLKRLLRLQGYGTDVRSILQSVTYGHHWKEYAAPEIVELFARLSPDFAVEIAFYDLRPNERWKDLKSATRDLSHRFAKLVPKLQDEIEAVVTLKAKTCWLAEAPPYH